MHRNLALVVLLAANTVANAPLYAQDTADLGFQLVGAEQAPLAPSSAYATLSNGDRIEARAVAGTSLMSVVRVDAAGNPLATLLTYTSALSTTIYTSFVELDPSESQVLVGENSDGNLWRVAVDGSSQQWLTSLAFNFDAVWESANSALISAATCGFPCNQILRLDTQSGVTTTLVQMPTYSGPLARHAATGDVYYGFVDATFSGIGDTILRFSAAQLSSGNLLSEQDASVFASGIQGASSLVIEERYGASIFNNYWRLYCAESPFSGGSQILAFRPNGSLECTVAQSPFNLSTLELQYASSEGAFARFQPDAGARLRYKSTDYSVFPAVNAWSNSARPARPQATISGPGLGVPGSVTFSLSGGVPNASFMLIVSPVNLSGPTNTRWHPSDFLWHTTMSWSSMRRLVTVPTDANGAGAFSFFNSASIQGQFLLQALAKDGVGTFVGSSTIVQN